MDSGIFLLQADNSLMRMNEQPYEAEALLQKLLADHSDLLAGDQINTDAPRRWLFIGREIGVPGEEGGSNWWSLDHLFLDQESVPTFVEVKRSSDTRARREVVAQMLDYAANATTYWPVSRMRELYAQTCDALGVEPEEYFYTAFDDEIVAEDFWARADQNLRTGRVRLLFVADRIPSELRRIVEFLNGQMNPAEVLALEVKQYVGPAEGSPLRTLVPRVIGQTEAAKTHKSNRMSGPPLPVPPVSVYSEVIPEEYRPGIEQIIGMAVELGYQLSTASTRTTQSLSFLVPGNPSAPISISSDGFLWISLGRSHQAIKAEAVRVRVQSILLDRFPAKRASIERKGQVGLTFAQIQSPEALAAIREVLQIEYDALRQDSIADS